MAYVQGSMSAYGLVFGLAVAACAGSTSQTDPQQQAGSGSASTHTSTAGKTGSSTSTSTPAPGTGTSAGTPPAAAGSGVRPASAGSAASAMAGERATPSTGAGGNQAGAPAADSGMRFSFFVTSWAAMQRVSGSADGFGGDLRHGEMDGLSGADKICREIAESSMPGAGSKTWRAFLSATKGPDGMPVNAIDRIGDGPWYDRVGRLFAMTKPDVISIRPKGADAMIINDFPNEDGVPNHAPDGAMPVDNHDVLTGTGTEGKLFSSDPKYTCQDWTSAQGAAGTPRVGHSWPRSGTPVMFPAAGSNGGGGPRMPPGGGAGRGGPPQGPMGDAAGSGGGGRSSGDHWMSALNEAGCAPGASLVEMGGPNRNNPTVGSGGGYGGIYCFALTP